MTQLVSLQQAARNALAEWLTTELEGTDAEVEPRWVESDVPLVNKRITIIDAGPRQIEWLQPEVLAATNVDLEGSTPVQKVDAVWNFGFITQPLQLDIWAHSDVELDDLIARLDASLNKGTLGIGAVLGDSFSPGLALTLEDGWSPGVADFVFDEPTIQQAPSSVGEGEWRASYRGIVNAQMVQTARSARIARILLKQRLRAADPINTADPPDVTIITSTS